MFVFLFCSILKGKIYFVRGHFLLIIECFITLLNPNRNMKGFINLFRSNQPIIFYQFAVVNKYTCHYN